jgi:hypothetical protein
MTEPILDLVALTARAIQAGETAISKDLCGQLLKAGPESPTALSLAAALDLSLGDIDRATSRIEAALRHGPNNLSANIEAIHIFLKAGQTNRSVVHSQRVLDQIPAFPGLVELYVKHAFGNSDYLDFLPLLHECLEPKIYLETGVEHGYSFRNARGAEIAIGIDPQMGNIPPEFHHWGRLFEMTSDDFFAAGHYEDTCGDRRIDTAFIDGMHQFEYALRDFINVERRANAKSVVLIHDIIPMNIATAERSRRTAVWMGDVWKIMMALTHHRPELELAVIDVGPSGLAVVRGLDPSNTVLATKYDEIVADLMDRPLIHGFLDNLGVRRVKAEESEIRAFLAS